MKIKGEKYMSGWKKRERELFIPGMDEASLNKIECEVCGNKFIPRKENKYMVKDRMVTGGVQSALNGQYSEAKKYDAFDCEVCGCQIIAKERLKQVNEVN